MRFTRNLLHQNHLAGYGLTISLETVEVNTGRDVAGIEVNFVRAGLHGAILKHGDPGAGDVVNRQLDL